VLRYTVPAGDREQAVILERQLLRYLKPYKILGEWRNLSPDTVHTVVQRLLSGEDRSFLSRPLIQP
jgi:hypothetical protein